MIVGIDASNIHYGGGLTHLVELLRAATPEAQGISQVVVWSGKASLDKMAERPWLVKAHVPALDRGLRHRMFWQRFHLSTVAREARCDVLFVPGGSYAGSFRPMVSMSQNLLPFDFREIRRYGWTVQAAKWLTLRWVQEKSFRHADGVIFLTEFARDAVLKITGPHRCPTTVVPHGVRDTFTCAPRPQLPISSYSKTEPFRLLYVSVVDMYKHQWHVADAAALLKQAGLPITLDLVGPSYGPALERLQGTLRRLDPSGTYIRFTGPVPHEEMHQLYRNANIALFASSCETFGQIVTEAMSAGVPLACSNRSAIPEVVGDTGVYFDPENPADIAAVISSLIDSPALRAEKAAAAFERVRSFTWTRCADQTFAFLRSCS